MAINEFLLQSDGASTNLLTMGTTDAQAKANGFTNAERLNAYTTGRGWVNGAIALDFRRKRVPLSAVWDMGQLNGLSLYFTGGHEAHSENQFGSQDGLVYNIGGPSSAIVWANKENLSGEMISCNSAYFDALGMMTLCGNYHWLDPSALKADSANRKEKGMVVYGKDAAGVCPPGKNDYINFTGICLQTAIETAVTPTEDAADQLKFGRCFSHYCDTFFKSKNIQSLDCEFGQMDQLYTPVGFDYEAGGMHRCRSHVLQAGCTHGLKITGNDTKCKSSFITDRMVFDGTSAANTIGIYVKASSGGTSNMIDARLDVTPSIVNRTLYPLVWSEGSYSHFHIHDSDFLHSAFIHVSGGNATYFPWFVISKNRFRNGTNLNSIRSLFTTASRGHVGVIFADNTEIAGGSMGAPSAFYYPPVRALINITGDATHTVVTSLG